MAIRHESGRSKRLESLAPYNSSNGGQDERDDDDHNNGRQKSRMSDQKARVFFGNLPYSTTVEELTEFVEDRCKHKVSSCKIFVGPDGRSKGSGLVLFSSVTEADHAINDLNDTEYNGRVLTVRFDRDPPHKTFHAHPFEKTTDPNLITSNKIFVGNLSWSIQWQDLKEHMSQVGEVLNVEILKSQDGRSKGCAIVEFLNIEGAREAIRSLQDSDLKGRPLLLKADRLPDRSNGSGGGGYNKNNHNGMNMYHQELMGVGYHPPYPMGAPMGGPWGPHPDMYGGPMYDDGYGPPFNDRDHHHPYRGPPMYPNPPRGFGGPMVAAVNAAGALGPMAPGGHMNPPHVDGYMYGEGHPPMPMDFNGPPAMYGGGPGPGYPGGGMNPVWSGGYPGVMGPGPGPAGYPNMRGGPTGFGVPGPIGQDPMGPPIENHTAKVFVSNLSWEVTWQDLKDHFKSVGEVLRADVILNEERRSKGCGTVEFSNAMVANQAIQLMNGTSLKGRTIYVREDKDKYQHHHKSQPQPSHMPMQSPVMMPH